MITSAFSGPLWAGNFWMEGMGPMEQALYNNYVKILQEELIPAMGCTEPIALAFAAAKAREVLGRMPQRMVVRCSGNIIKNVKGVVVPNSGGQKGVAAAAVLGVVGGRPELELQVISKTTPEQMEETKRLVAAGICDCQLAEGVDNLFIHVELYAGEDSAVVEVRTKHNHISLIQKNGQVLFQQEYILVEKAGDKCLLNLRDILTFADEVELDDVRQVIQRQIDYNSAISAEGLKNPWGAQVGRTLLESIERPTLRAQARAAAAAGSDARMGGCALPVVINSGSGNQGITCTMPVVTYAKAMGASQEKLLRAMVLTNLISLHQKRYIGNLSAYCGAVSAGTSAACGIAYLEGAGYDVIGKTILNALGNAGGIVCDGAKASCAAKIASAVEAGIMGYEMAKRGRVFPFGEGLVETDYEQTIRNIGYMGRVGMQQTDVTILNIMLDKIDA